MGRGESLSGLIVRNYREIYCLCKCALSVIFALHLHVGYQVVY